MRLVHDRHELGIEMAEQRQTHGGKHARMDVARTGAEQDATGRIERSGGFGRIVGKVHGEGSLFRGCRRHKRFNKVADDFETRVVRAADPLEEDRLGRGDDRAGEFEAAQGEFPVDVLPRGDGVGGDLHQEPQAEQFKRRLGDANVGFDPRDRDVTDAEAVELLKQKGDRAAIEPGFRRSLGDEFGEFGDGRAKSFGILFGGPERQIEHCTARTSRTALATIRSRRLM